MLPATRPNGRDLTQKRSITSFLPKYNFNILSFSCMRRQILPNLKIQFGKRLKTLRKQAGLTQEQLAEATGLTIESISNIERGLFGPKFDNLEKIANEIGVEVKELFQFD